MKIALLGNVESSMKIKTFLQFDYDDIYFVSDGIEHIGDLDMNVIDFNEYSKNLPCFECHFISSMDYDIALKRICEISKGNRYASPYVVIDKQLLKSKKIATELLHHTESVKFALNISAINDPEYLRDFVDNIDSMGKEIDILVNQSNILDHHHWTFTLLPLICIACGIADICIKTHVSYQVAMIKTPFHILNLTIKYCDIPPKVEFLVGNKLFSTPNQYNALMNIPQGVQYTNNQVSNIAMLISKMVEEYYAGK